MTALTSAFMRNKFFGITAIGQRGAMAPTAKAKHALKRVDRVISTPLTMPFYTPSRRAT